MARFFMRYLGHLRIARSICKALSAYSFFKMNVPILVCRLAMLLSIVSNGVNAEDVRESTLESQQKKILRIAVDPFPPWIIVETGRDPEGIDVRIGQRIAEELGYAAHYIVCPWARCLRMMEVGTADVMLNVFRSKERERYIEYIEPPISQDPPKAFFMRVDDERDIQDYKDLYDLKLGTVRDTIYFERFDKDRELKTVALVSDPLMIEMLIKGRVDAIIGTKAVIDYHLALMGRQGALKQVTYQTKGGRPTYLGISKKSPFLSQHERTSAAIEKLGAAGDFRRISEEFFDNQLRTLSIDKEDVWFQPE